MQAALPLTAITPFPHSLSSFLCIFTIFLHFTSEGVVLLATWSSHQPFLSISFLHLYSALSPLFISISWMILLGQRTLSVLSHKRQQISKQTKVNFPWFCNPFRLLSSSFLSRVNLFTPEPPWKLANAPLFHRNGNVLRGNQWPLTTAKSNELKKDSIYLISLNVCFYVSAHLELTPDLAFGSLPCSSCALSILSSPIFSEDISHQVLFPDLCSLISSLTSLAPTF